MKIFNQAGEGRKAFGLLFVCKNGVFWPLIYNKYILTISIIYITFLGYISPEVKEI